MNLRKQVLFALVLLTASSAWAQQLFSGGSGTSDAPYQISSTGDLDQLATNVNNGMSYSGTYFELTQDITYTCNPSDAWNDATGTANNFTAIGTENRPFAGIFNGQNHTISGIRIYSNSNSYQGLFGNNSGTVRNVTIANTRITGESYLGGIAGNNTGTIEYCRVMNDVMIHAAATSGIDYLGGIAGKSASGTISHCVSSVQITEVSGVTSSYRYGGITGYGQGLSNNIAYGVNISAKYLNYKAAIVGERSVDNLTNNYYINCSLINTSNNSTTTSGIGRSGGSNNGYSWDDVTTNDGAVAVWTITLADEYVTVTNPTTPTVSYNGTNYFKKCTVTLGHANRAQGIVFSEYRVTNDGTNSAVTVTNGSFVIGENNVTNVTAAAVYTIDWVGDGTEQTPYLIYERDQLDLLSTRVTNGVSNYSGKHFKLCDDITYPHTSAWNDLNSTENNFTPIGDPGLDENSKHFCGIFDGGNHMISGIRILKTGIGPYDQRLGIFRYLDEGGTVKNIILADTRISGHSNSGGIVGQMKSGTIENCHVLNDVLIRAYNGSTETIGGIVGQCFYNSTSTIKNCSSSATIDGPNQSNKEFGGIAGDSGSATVKNNMVIGASIDATSDGSYGAISGNYEGNSQNNKYSNNYYWNCKIGSSDINRARGSRGDNIPTNDGATPCFFITCGENVRTGVGSSTFTIPAHGNVAETTYVFSVDQRYVQVFYDAPHDHDDLKAVLTYTYTGDTEPADVTENSTFQMPYGDLTIRFKHYNLLNAIEPGKWYAISSPMHDEGQNYSGVETYFYSESIADGTNLATDTYDLFRYKESNMTWENYKNRNGEEGDFNTLEVGRGYIYRIGGPSNATLQYRGVENSGDIYSMVYNSRPSGNTVPLDEKGGTKDANDDQLYGFNLIGNPYPHQVYYGTGINSTDLDMFFYYTLEPNGSWRIHLANENRPIGTCEAILVYASATGRLEFSDNANPPAQNSGKTLMFTVSNGTNEDVAYAVLGTANEKGMPKIAHMEAGLPSLSIRMGGNRYAMAAIEEETTELPLNFSGKTGKYTISVEAMENAGYLHLIDLQTGNDIDLLSQSTYTFTQSGNNTSAQGDRFLVKFSQDNSQLSTFNSLFAYQSGDQTIITGTGALQVFDLMGRQLLSAEVDSSPFSLHRSQFPATGVYILRLDGQTQKIVIK